MTPIRPRCDLLSPTGEVLGALSPGESARIGRAPTNDVCCTDPSVSRHHARVTWPEGVACPVVSSSGAANGVRLDGVRVFDLAPLRDGAALQLGRQEIRIRLSGLPSEPLPQGLPPAARPGPAASGQLSPSRPLAKLLCALEGEQATGTLEVTSPLGPLAFSLCLGRLLRLSSPWGSDAHALRQSLGVVSGTYRLDWNLEPGGLPLNLWVSDLLERERGIPRQETERLELEEPSRQPE